jgi:serine/threonine protein phosphatase PrpC
LSFKNNPDLKYFDQAVIAYPEITKLKITSDMEFIILACDGVWDCVDIQKLCEHISVKLKKQPKKLSTLLTELFDQIIAKTNNSIFKII